MNSVLYNTDGSIHSVIFGGSEEDLRQAADQMSKPCVITDDFVGVDTHYVSGGVVLPIPEKPANANAFNYQSGTWSFDISDARISKWEEIKKERDWAEFGSFSWSDHIFDCDEVSQRRIQGAVQLAQLDSSTSLDWTLADNTIQTFNATELQQIGQALAAHVNACHVKARGLRDQINAAENEAELSVISW